MGVNSTNFNYRYLIEGPTGITLSQGGNPPYLYVFCKFKATNTWLFGRTQFRFNVLSHPGVTVSGATIMDADPGLLPLNNESILDIVCTGGSVLANQPILYNPSGGLDNFVINQYYWIGFQITLGGPIDFDVSSGGASILTNTITANPSSNNWLFPGDNVININFAYTP